MCNSMGLEPGSSAHPLHGFGQVLPLSRAVGHLPVVVLAEAEAAGGLHAHFRPRALPIYVARSVPVDVRIQREAAAAMLRAQQGLVHRPRLAGRGKDVGCRPRYAGLRLQRQLQCKCAISGCCFALWHVMPCLQTAETAATASCRSGLDLRAACVTYNQVKGAERDAEQP